MRRRGLSFETYWSLSGNVVLYREEVTKLVILRVTT
jgi:hypothetical protein